MNAFKKMVLDSDELGFMSYLETITTGLLIRHSPQEVYLIRIKNWFDQKWLRFSGIGCVDFNYGFGSIDTAIDEFRQTKLTFPPFTPDRVIQEQYFCRTKSCRYQGQEPRQWIHNARRRRSATNINRSVASFSKSGCFVWFSSDTDANQQGCIMACSVIGSDAEAWYLALRNDKGWKIKHIVGASEQEANSLVLLGAKRMASGSIFNES